MPVRALETAMVTLAVMAFLAASGTAGAADLSGNAYDPYASPYDDPRYAELYGRKGSRYDDPYSEDLRARDDDTDYEGYDEKRHAAPYSNGRYPDGYERYGNGSLKDDGWLDPLPHPPKFSERGYRHWRRYALCSDKYAIRHRLRGLGWHGFHRGHLNGDLAYVRAYRRHGQLFQLALDRCTGDIVSVRRVRHGFRDDFAYRWGRPGRFD